MSKRYLTLVTILVVVVFILAGCGSQSSATTEKKGDMTAMCDKSDSSKSQATSSLNKVETATNTPQSTNAGQVFEGWLMDKMSSDTLEPEKKTKECLLMPMMEQSGYGVLVKQQDNTFKFYKFDEAGHKLAKETILDKTTKTENIKITVKGVIEGELIKLSSIQELS